MAEDKRKVVIEKYRTFLKVLHKDLDGVKDYSINPMCSEYKINKSVPQVLQRRGIVGKNIFGKYEWTSKYKPNRKMIEGILKDISTLNNKQKKEKQKNMTNEQETIETIEPTKRDTFLDEVTERVGDQQSAPIMPTEEILKVVQPEYTINKHRGIEIQNRLLDMTPQLAETLLERNLNNRPFSKTNLRYLMKEIACGNWIFDGNPIRIDISGNVLDGQHRLRACIDSGKNLVMSVICGIDPKAFTVIDSGIIRTGADTLSIAGITNAPLTATTIKHINLFTRGSYGDTSASRTLSPQNMLDFYNADSKRISEDVTIGKKLTKGSSRLVTPSVVCSLLYLFSKKDRTMALDFITKMCSGTNIEDGSPINALRNRLMKSKMDTTQSLKPSTIVKLIIYAWNKYRAGTKSKVLKIPTEKTITIN